MKNPGWIVVLAALVLGGPVTAQGPGHESIRFQQIEIEPNHDPWNATSLTRNYYGSGEISPWGDIDWWDAGLQDFFTLVFAYCDTSSSNYRDSQLGVYSGDPDNLTLIEFDDDDGPSLSSCIAGAVIPEIGSVFFRVNEYLDDGEIAPYDLHQHITIEQGNSEFEPNNDASTADGMDNMVFQEGSLPAGDPADWFFFDADAGDLLVVIVDDDPDDDGNLLDTDLAIIGGDGSTVLAQGDNGNGDANCAGAVVAPVGGEYFVRITDGGAGGGDVDYRFVVLIDGVLVPVELQSFSIE